MENKMPFQTQNTRGENSTLILSGYVDKIIPAIVPGQCVKMQISIRHADELYREIRIPLQLDGNGSNNMPKVGSEVEIVIRVRT